MRRALFFLVGVIWLGLVIAALLAFDRHAIGAGTRDGVIAAATLFALVTGGVL